MKQNEIAPGIFRLSAPVQEELFESMWPIPSGMVMNSYLVRGNETAIIDGVCGWDGVPETLFAQLDAMKIRPHDIRYVVVNHLEPDHSGWLEELMQATGSFTVLATEKGIQVGDAFFNISSRFKTKAVKTGDTVDLGEGKRLVFMEIPNVHWPETMATYEASSGTLFSCDAFGSFGAVPDDHFTDADCTEEELQRYEKEALRYYANIVSSFSPAVLSAIKVLGSVDVRIVAPGHGLVWKRDPQRIIRLYEQFAMWGRGSAVPEVTLIWGSMYGMTAKAVEAAKKGVQDAGIPLRVFRVPHHHVSDILASSLKSQGIILGIPTYEYRMFPPIAHVLDDMGRKKILGRTAFCFGSYGWSGGALKELEEIIGKYKMDWSFIDPISFKGQPQKEDLEKIYQSAKNLAESLKK
ncbi:MAG: FprA family A-type flavoprotein [Treponemataceae bacterium]|nr:FprA family A-type flavoprotein [Treponemataceae bacterium]